MILRHSYSSLKEFDNCPKRYHHTRIIKDVKDVGGEASIYGDRVHKALEERVRDGVALPDDLEKHEPLCAAISGMPGKVYAELELALDKNLNPAGWWDDSAWIRSKLDVFVDAGKKALIADYKTGKRRPDFFQLEVSAAQVFIHYPEVQAIQTAFLWLKESTRDDEPYYRKDLQRILDKMGAKIDRIEAAVVDDVWPAKPSGLCGYCPAKDICSFAQKYRRR